MAYYYAWRGDLVYGIYRRMGGSRSRETVSGLFEQETDILDYKNMVGGWMKQLLEEEGQAPGAAVLDCLKHPVGRMTWDRWVGLVAEADASARVGKAAAAEAEVVKVEGAPRRRRIRHKRPPLPHEVALQIAMKRPAAKKKARGAQVRCQGRPERSCRCAADGSGMRARGEHDRRCVFCSPPAMARALKSPQGRGNVARRIKAWRTTAPDLAESVFTDSALAEVEAAARERVRQASLRPEDKARVSWATALGSRRSIMASRTVEEERDYKTRVEADRGYVIKKFFPKNARRVRHAGFLWKNPMSENLEARVKDAASNDTGLPGAFASKEAEMAEAWCKRGSWAVCERCGSVQPRHLKEADFKREHQKVQELRQDGAQPGLGPKRWGRPGASARSDPGGHLGALRD